MKLYHISLFAAASSTLIAGELTVTGQTAEIKGPQKGNQLGWNGKFLHRWHSDRSVPSWKFKALKSGTINISIELSNEGHSGTECLVKFGDSQQKFKVKDTGSWSKFETVSIGSFSFTEGDHTLKIIPKSLKTRAVMDLKSITFTGDTQHLQVIKPRKINRVGVLEKLRSPHPSMKATDLTPGGIDLRVTGIDFLSDGTMVLSSWDKWGSVYLVTDYEGSRENMKFHRFASGLAEPLGVTVVDDEIYVLQKQELTRLRDTNKDGTCDSYEVVCNAWDVSGNFHEFAFCPVYKDGYFYTALAIAVNPGGATTNPQQKDRGTFIKIDPKTGQYEVLAAGFRTPNGVALSADKSRFYLNDNQGDYLPASKLVEVREGRFYNHKYTPAHPLSKLSVSPPIVWLPQNEIGNSPTQPLELTSGPYAGQIIFGDIHHGGLKRVNTEEVNGELQGTVFRFAQNLRGGINRLSLTPKGSLIIGNAGSRGNWGNGLRNGMMRINFDENPVFEIHSVKTLTNGIELTFTKPLAQKIGWDPSSYLIDSYTYKPTIKYGGPKIDRHNLEVKSASVSSDRTKVFLEIPNIKPNYLVHGALYGEIVSADKDSPWAAEWWTTVNQIPSDKLGQVLPVPASAIIEQPGPKAEITKDSIAQTLYAENCQSCHTTDTQRLVGPGLGGLLGKTQTVIKNGKEQKVKIDKSYLKRAILDPSHEYPKGFQPIMPSLGDNLKQEQIDALVEWISKLK